MDFSGSVAILTGAASGMGLLFSENYADLGGAFGNCMSLFVYEYDECAIKEQPLLRDMKLIRELV